MLYTRVNLHSSAAVIVMTNAVHNIPRDEREDVASIHAQCFHAVIPVLPPSGSCGDKDATEITQSSQTDVVHL